MVPTSKWTFWTGETFAIWQKRFFSDAELLDSTVSGPSADPDRDGVKTKMEFALNVSPRIPDATAMTATTGTRGLPLIRWETISGQHRLTVEYVRRRADTAPEITYTVQFSSNLTSWGVTGTSVVTTIDRLWERVKVTDSLFNQTKRFGRVSVN